MKFYFPNEKLQLCPLGFNLIPMKKVQENPDKYRPDLSSSPFADYTHDVISISDERFINTDKVKELTSYVLLHCDDGWLVVDEPDGSTRLGLLKIPVNRGEEANVYSLSFNAINTGEMSGNQPIIILGYFNDLNKVIFVGRFDFSSVPFFVSSPEVMRLIQADYLLSEDFVKKEKLDPLSKRVAEALRSSMLKTLTQK